MEPSSGVRETMLQFYDGVSTKDVARFDLLVSSDPATVVIGTAPGEIVRERERLRYGFETEGVRLEAGDPQGYEEGTMGWLVDEPTFIFPDGSTMRCRLTSVMRREDDAWKIVHAHFSVGVPDEEVTELQAKWGS